MSSRPDDNALKVTADGFEVRLPGSRDALGSAGSLVGFMVLFVLLWFVFIFVIFWVFARTQPGIRMRVKGSTLIVKRGNREHTWPLEDVDRMAWEIQDGGDHATLTVWDREGRYRPFEDLLYSIDGFPSSTDYDEICALVNLATGRPIERGLPEEVPDALRRIRDPEG